MSDETPSAAGAPAAPRPKRSRVLTVGVPLLVVAALLLGGVKLASWLIRGVSDTFVAEKRAAVERERRDLAGGDEAVKTASGVALALQTPPMAAESVVKGHLVREIVRQGVLLAARDELGLPTRDRALGEPLSEEAEGTLPVLDVRTSIDGQGHVRVTIDRVGEPSDRPGDFEFELPKGVLLDELVTKIESLTGGEFVAALEKAGFQRKTRTRQEGSTIASIRESELFKFEILSQFDTLRALHAEIGSLGESPERLSALARVYAHLGTLTDFLWCPAPRVFRARSLLYAQRLMRHSNGAALALWTRGYVRALAGLHSSALVDLAAAGEVKGGSPPAWVPVIEAFCRSDSTGLATLMSTSAAAPLAFYLKLLADEWSPSLHARHAAAERMLAVEPGCELAFEVLLYDAALGVQREGTEKASSQFSASLRNFLPGLGNLPADVRKLVMQAPDDMAKQMTARARLVEALTDEGRLGRDAGEPSVAALGTLIRELSFVEACRLLDEQHFALGVDTAAALAAVQPITSRHRYQQFIGVHVYDQIRATQNLNGLLRTMDRTQLDPGALPIVHLYGLYGERLNPGSQTPAELGDQFAAQTDRVFSDLAHVLLIHATDGVKAEAAAALREISPGSPLGIVGGIRHDWNRVQPSIAEWERKHFDNPEIVSALAEGYTSAHRFEDAERCLKRQLELRAEHSAYKALAKLYWNHGDESRWLDTVKRSLLLPSQGLEDTEAHNALAKYYMLHKEWKLARPHVEQAARSYASYGLLCASEYYELTGDWKRAEEYQRMNAERYESAVLDWYKWCRRTGHGDVDAARRFGQARVDRMRTWPSAEGQLIAAVYEQLEDHPAKALDVFQSAFHLQPVSYYAVHAALLADELGQQPLRNELLQKAQATSNRDVRMAELVRLFRKALADGPRAKFNRDALDWAIRDRTDDNIITAKYYLTGTFLALRGEKALATEYLQLAATTPFTQKEDYFLAAYELRKQGIPVGARRGTPFDEQITKARRKMQEGIERHDRGEFDKSVATFSELIEAHPQFVEGHEWRAVAYERQEKFEEAAADWRHAHKMLPEIVTLDWHLGQVSEYLGQYEAAITHYQSAFEKDPRFGGSHYALAMLFAACPDPKYRDGAKAEKHAREAFSSGEIPKNLALTAMAVAAAEAGQFDRAISIQTQAVQETPAGEQPFMRNRLEMFQRGEAYRRGEGWWRKR